MESSGDHAPAADTQSQTPGESQLVAAARVFALLADPTRLHLVWLLTQGEADVNTLAQATGAAQPTVSQHLAKLRLAGLVEPRREGRRSIYELRDGHLRRLVLEGLSHADHQVSGMPWHD